MRLVTAREYGTGLSKLDQLTDNDILYMHDVFDYSALMEIFNNKGRSKYVVADHWCHVDYPDVPIYTLPLYAVGVPEIIKPLTETDYQTRCTFNFLVNKKQVNRFLCLKLVEFFKLSNYEYTHSGYNSEFNMENIIQELDSLGNCAPLTGWDRGFILGPSTIPSKYFLMGDNLQDGIRLGISDIRSSYYNHIQHVIKHSAISLITESNWGQRASTFTEKTVFAALGLTLPIWVGGWQQATGWKRLGLDTFDDIINHNYQNYETQIERCYYAFADNIDLLTNHEKTAKLREQLMPRLKHNQELLLNGCLINYTKTKIANWPAELQAVVPDILGFFPKIKEVF
jgi:hypothetical protein